MIGFQVSGIRYQGEISRARVRVREREREFESESSRVRARWEEFEGENKTEILRARSGRVFFGSLAPD